MRRIPILFLILVLWPVSRVCGQEKGSLVLSGTISLPGVQGGFNHMSVDSERLRLFAAAPTNQTVEVVDLKTNKPWRSLGGERPAAVRYAPEFDQVYVSRGQGVSIYDGKTLELITSIDLGSSLDELQYNPGAKRLYVGCMTEGKTGIAVIAIPEGKLVGKIALPSKPQGIAVEQQGSRVFANLPTSRQVAVMDSETLTLKNMWQLERVDGNTPLGLDEAHHRLFVGARHPAQLVVLDSTNGKTIARIDMNGDADDLFYDAANRRIYISCGEGYIDVVAQMDADHYRLLERIATIAGARTSALSESLQHFYLGVSRHEDHPAELRVYQVR